MKDCLQDARAANERLRQEILKLSTKAPDEDQKFHSNLLLNALNGLII